MNQVWVFFKLQGALTNDFLLAVDRINQGFFAVDTANARTLATLNRPLFYIVVALHLVQGEYRALGWIAWIVTPHPSRVRLHGADFFFDNSRLLAQPNGVVVGLRHFFAVKSGHL